MVGLFTSRKACQNKWLEFSHPYQNVSNVPHLISQLHVLEKVTLFIVDYKCEMNTIHMSVYLMLLDTGIKTGCIEA